MWRDKNFISMKKKLTLMTLVLLWVSQMMAVDYTINVQSAGCDAVAYTLPSGAVGQIQAMPNTGRHFTQWSDGNTENPRTITVTGDKTYTAQYAPIFITTEVEVEGAYNVEIPDAAKNFAVTKQYAYMCGIELEYPAGTKATDYKWMKLNVSGDVRSFRIGHDHRVGWLYQGVDEAYKIIEGETVPSGEQLANADSLTIWIDLGARNMEGADTLHSHILWNILTNFHCPNTLLFHTDQNDDDFLKNLFLQQKTEYKKKYFILYE